MLVRQDYNLFDYEHNESKRGYFYEYTGLDCETINPSYEDITYFNGNGDFRSRVIKASRYCCNKSAFFFI